jgi:heme oxygenase (biliverdin-producing, ferredoxin)
MDGKEDDFTTELRTRTRQAHRASNAAVTLTAPLALSSRAVYRLGLKAFYYVYQAMEAELERRRVDCPAVASIYFPELRRAPAFERDLAFYYGPSWRATMGPPSRATTKYLEEVRRSVDENPLRLVAWCHVGLGLYFFSILCILYLEARSKWH